MKVKIRDLWRYPQGLMVGEKYKEAMYLGKSFDCIVLWKDGKAEYIEEWDDEEEVTVLDYKVDLDKLIDVKKMMALGLIDDGWRIGSKSLNLEDTLDEIRTLVALRSALEGR
jgi:hypothetical protein